MPSDTRRLVSGVIATLCAFSGCADTATPEGGSAAAGTTTAASSETTATSSPATGGSGSASGGSTTAAPGTSGEDDSGAESSTESSGGTPDDPIEGGWQTSFDYAEECSQRANLGNADCGVVADDGIYWNWGANTQGGHSTQAVADANYPGGAGGLGFRSWVGDGNNIQTGEARIDFDGAQTELWIRWYQRYQAGFAWEGGTPYYDKTLYIWSEGNSAVNPQHAAIPQAFAMTALGSPDEYQAVASNGIDWNDVFGDTSDGQWHLFEIHIRMDSDSTDGVAQMWIEGDLVIDESDVDYSGGDPASRDGWTWLEFHSNQNAPLNGGFAYVDYDDMAIFTTPPPRNDPAGNPWIGPV